MKHWYWILMMLGGVAVLIGVPYLLNALILYEQHFEIVGEGKDWLMFWVTWLSAFASFAMVLITWYTLRQNKKIIDEQNRPKIVCGIRRFERRLYFVIQNTGLSMANSVSINISKEFTESLLYSKTSFFLNKLNDKRIILEPQEKIAYFICFEPIDCLDIYQEGEIAFYDDEYYGSGNQITFGQNDRWIEANKDKTITVTGSYDENYIINEVFTINHFLHGGYSNLSDKTNVLNEIKKSIGNNHCDDYSIQHSLSQLVKLEIKKYKDNDTK